MKHHRRPLESRAYLGAPQKAALCRWGHRRNPLHSTTKESNKLSTSCSPNDCTLNSCCGYLTDTVVLVVSTPANPDKAGRFRKDYVCLQLRGSGKPGLGQGLVTCIQCPALPALLDRPETRQEGGCTCEDIAICPQAAKKGAMS